MNHDPYEGLFGKFNRGFDSLIRSYTAQLRGFLKKISLWGAAFALLIAVCGVLFMFLPSSFLPDEDQGTLYVDVQLPPGATIERTKKVVEEIDTYFRTVEKDSIQSVMSVIGWG